MSPEEHAPERDAELSAEERDFWTELKENADLRYERFDGTDPYPSEWCPECDAPPFRPHREGCSEVD